MAAVIGVENFAMRGGKTALMGFNH